MTDEKCMRCNGKGKRGLLGGKCSWCGGTGIFRPGPCPNCKGKGKVRPPMTSIDDDAPSGVHFTKQVVGLDGLTACTKCNGTGQSINRPHSAIGDK